MLKKTILVALLLSFAIGQEANSKYVEPIGGFSYTIPQGWVLREVPGWKYKVAFGPPINGFAPNINVVDETYSGTVDDYAESNLKVIFAMADKLGMKNFRLISKTAFTTSLQQHGVKAVIESEREGKPIWQSFYFFGGKDGKRFVVTCTVPLDVKEQYRDLRFGHENLLR